MSRILITGSNGQLGFDIINELQGSNHLVKGIDISDLDITDRLEVLKYFDDFKPDIIFHCAAYTAVDAAEENEEICRNVNAMGTKYIVEAAKKANAKIIYISTDYVFDGKKKTPYIENDICNPMSVYGKTKKEGEDFVLQYDKYFIVRISWVFGINGNNFINAMIRLSKTRNQISVVDDQIGSPTYTKDLARFLVELSKTKKYGIYHSTNSGFCSWYEFAKEIFKITNSDIKLIPIASKDFPTRAIRPKNSCMSKRKMEEEGFQLLPRWQDAVKRYLLSKEEK